MKMVMISYNSAINSQVMEILLRCGVEGHTRWTQVQGRGKSSGSHFGSEIWPGENSVLFCAVDENKAADLLKCIKELRMKFKTAGIKAFVWLLEEVT